MFINCHCSKPHLVSAKNVDCRGKGSQTNSGVNCVTVNLQLLFQNKLECHPWTSAFKDFSIISGIPV